MTEKPNEHSPLLKYEQQIEMAEVPSATVLSGIFNLLITMIGAGAMAMPFTFRESGWLLGCAIMLICALITYVSCVAIVHCCHLSCDRDYDKLIVQFLGNTAGTIINVFYFLLLYGALCLFLLISVDLLYPFLSVLPFWLLRLLITAIIIILSLPTSLHALRHTSLLAIFCLIFILFALIYRLCQKGLLHELSLLSSSSIPKAVWNVAAGMALPLQGLAFACHLNIPRLQSELPDRSRMDLVLMISIFMGLVFYIALTFAGFLYFDGLPGDDILKDFPASDVLMDSCRIFLSLILILKSPLLLQPCREMTETYLSSCYPISRWGWTSRPRSFTWNVLLTALVGIIVMLLTILLPQLSLAMELIGSTSGSLIAFVAPGAMLYAANSVTWSERQFQTPNYTPSFWLIGKAGRITGVLIVLFGVLTAVVGIIDFISALTVASNSRNAGG